MSERANEVCRVRECLLKMQTIRPAAVGIFQAITVEPDDLTANIRAVPVREQTRQNRISNVLA